MNFAERVSKHPIHKTLQNAKARASNEAILAGAAQMAATGDLARTSKALSYIESVINNADVDLVSIHALSEVQQQVHVIAQHLPNCANADHNALNHVNNATDNALNLLPRCIVFTNGKPKTAYKQALKAYSEVFHEEIEQQKKASESLLQELSKMREKGDAWRNNVSKEIIELEKRLEEVRDVVDKTGAEFSTQFNADQGSRRAQFDNQILKFQDRIEGTIDGAKQSLSNLYENIDELSKKSNDNILKNVEKQTRDAHRVIMSLEKLKDDAQQVFGIVQNTVQAGAHMRYANEERTQANWYRISAIVVMSIAVLVLIGPEIYKLGFVLHGEPFSWDELLKRLPISLVLFVPGFYLARESSGHRKNEISNRKQELILRTIDPYLSLLPEERRQDIKADVARSLFATSEPHSEGIKDAELLDRALSLVKEAAKVKS